MSAREIDEAATATAVGKQAAEYLTAHEDTAAVAAASIAQVHATLALVEQQRVANLIALASLRIDPLDTPPLRHLAIEPRDEFDVQPVAEIRETLGLG